MKKSGIIIFTIILLFFVSCGSTPKNTTPAPVKNTDNARSLTDGQKITPPVVATDNDADEADAGITIFEQDDPSVINEDALKKAEMARDAAIAAGADKLGEAFRVTEQKYNDALDSAAKGDARDALADITIRYNALENYAKALALKEKIDSENLAGYDMANYNKGEQAIEGLDAMFADPNSSSRELRSRATDALDAYTIVLNVAYRRLAIEAREMAMEAKRRADSVMAGVAAKEEYGKCAQSVILGDGSFSRRDAASAYTYYMEAARDFDKLYAVVSELRAKAAAAMEAARKSVADSHQYAVLADERAPITDENQEGIEHPDAVLIEVETYADPLSAEVDIPDQIEEDM